MGHIRKDTLITVLDPDIGKPTCVDAWFQHARAEGGFYAVLVEEPGASRFFSLGQLREAPGHVWRAVKPANVVLLRPRPGR
jgi:hypothetical protein